MVPDDPARGAARGVPDLRRHRDLGAQPRPVAAGVWPRRRPQPPSSFTKNAWSVGALQAAWSAITHTPVPTEGPACGHLADALTTAIRIGHDTDTVAAIAGALLGARWGMSAVPSAWRRLLHGWPGIRGVELERLAYLTVHGGRPGKYGWPLVDHIDYAHLQYGLPAMAQHPYDDGVYISGATVLDELPDDIDAVVSLCLTGRTQVKEGLEHLNFRIMDEADRRAEPQPRLRAGRRRPRGRRDARRGQDGAAALRRRALAHPHGRDRLRHAARRPAGGGATRRLRRAAGRAPQPGLPKGAETPRPRQGVQG